MTQPLHWDFSYQFVLLRYKFYLTTTHFLQLGIRLLSGITLWCLLHHLHTELTLCHLFNKQVQAIATMRLCNISYIEALQTVRAIEVERPKVENMLYVLHAIDVSVDIHIAVTCLDNASTLSCFR